MYNNPYFVNYNSQPSIDRINAQINELEKMKEQMQKPIQQQPTNLTQNFQLAPTNNHTVRYANTIEDVEKEQVFYDTPFFSKDMSVLWFKSAKGDIQTYELTEIVPKDEKDIQIEMLQAQINELKKGMVVNEQPTTNVNTTEVSTDTTRDDEPTRTTTKENKSTSVQRVSTSKKK